MVVFSFICFLLVFAQTFAEVDRCIKIGHRDENGRDNVLCRVRTLDPEGHSLSAVPSESTGQLSIECSQVLLFESSMRAHYFERFQRVSDLTIRSCKLLKITDNTFEDVRDLKRLNIRTRNSDWSPSKHLELAVGTFHGLQELQTLDLGENNIRALPDNIFCSLDNLHLLNLTLNRIKDVTKLGFGEGCGSNLQTLDLSHNEIKSITELSDLVKLRRLQNIYLQHNNITEISGEAFNGLINLRILNISHNALHRLPEGIFASNRELREIHLNKNFIYELAKGVFHRLEQLLVLNLSDNQLSSNHIDDGAFIGLIRLIVLNLSHNALTRIDGKTFKDLFFLQILDLRNNTIGYIEENAFLPLYNLHTLNLAENRIHTIDEYLFNGLFVLSKLILNNNLIVKIDSRAFKNCSNLKELDLSSNQITDVPPAIWDLSFLKTLDLGENQISTFKNGSFKNLGQLTGLRLIDNQIGNLSVGMFSDLTNLQVLNLAKNRIQAIDLGTFTRNNQLEAIRLDGNFISDINGIFAHLKTLLWLNLSENHLVWFDYAFIPSNVKWLDIHSNFIEYLGNYYNMQEQINIKTLDVSHNRLLGISPAAIPNSVELLFINNNFIKDIEVNTFYDKRNLIRVDMYANEIVNMDLNSLRLSPVPENKTMPEFYIGGNPFNCDCSMDWLPVINNMTLMRQYPRMMDLENVMCKLTHSHSVTHIPLTLAKPSDFLCKYETHCFALCHCCDFDACDCEMTCPHNCNCYHDSTWNTNVVDCSRQNIIDIPERIPMDVTELYLDGNDFRELHNHLFIGRKNMRTLYVNSSNIERIQNRTFAGLSTLTELHLEDNKLTELRGFEFEYLINLKKLFLHNNVISSITNTTFTMLNSLEILRLDGNKLIDFAAWNLDSNANIRSLTLGNNPWSCKCKYLQDLTVFMTENAQKIRDITEMWCWSSEVNPPIKRKLDSNTTACSDYFIGGGMIDNMLFTDYLPMTVTTLMGFLLILFALVVVFIFRDPLRVWLFTNCGIRVFSFAGVFEERNKLYDGYICYSPKDEEFVIQSLGAELESGNPSYHLCMHYRDIPHNGSSYMTTSPLLVEAADASKRLIIVLTRNFMETEWSRFDFRQALNDALKGQIYKLILIEEGQIVSEAMRDADLRPYLKTASRVRWGEKRFWEKLKYFLPDVPRERHKSKTHNYRRNINTYTLETAVPNGAHVCYDKAYGSVDVEVECTPEHCNSDRIVVRSNTTYGADGRPTSDHIYSSIDSDYSTLERAGRRREPRHWPAPPPLLNSHNTVQGYLV